MFDLLTDPVATVVPFFTAAVLVASATSAASSDVRRTSAREFDILVFLDGNFIIITFASAFHCSGTLELVSECDPSAGRHESKQLLASCESLRRSRFHCVGFKLNSKFGLCYRPSALRVVVFFHEPGAFHQ